jgi:hypothetical protein
VNNTTRPTNTTEGIFGKANEKLERSADIIQESPTPETSKAPIIKCFISVGLKLNLVLGAVGVKVTLYS